MRAKYIECLNDLMDHFVLADVQGLTARQEREGWPDDLLHTFTTTEAVDQAVMDGVLLPLAGIENLPYTIYFTVGERSVFEALDSEVQHRVAGYALRVVSRSVHLFTLPMLRAWSRNQVLVANKPSVALQNGWYGVEVVAGETRQDTGWEPTLEFVFTPSEHPPATRVRLDHRFVVVSREY